ncbi:MAG: hypothetical protein CM1200mP2_16180 [Planctomycetaceae bacterium]|nr:MAG: hypothetical protein CM1200mP2_16180 [Planctomycetaceae bacterium]
MRKAVSNEAMRPSSSARRPRVPLPTVHPGDKIELFPLQVWGQIGILVFRNVALRNEGGA